MVIRATKINPEILRWARERAGYSIEDIARRRRVSPERVREWESGESFPTWKQFTKLAHEDYHRGTVFFFFRDLPEEKTVAERFPRLPPAMLADLCPDTLYAVRQASYRQEHLAELLGPDGAEERLSCATCAGWPTPAIRAAWRWRFGNILGLTPTTRKAPRAEPPLLKTFAA